MSTVKRSFELVGVDPVEVLGYRDSHLKLLRKRYPKVRIAARHSTVVLEGPESLVQQLVDVLSRMLNLARESGHMEEWEVLEVLGETERPSSPLEIITPKKKVVPRSPNQQTYVQAMLDNDMVFATGPAGTGKTFLAVAMALKMLRESRVERIILTRPAVEAGESLGFLPGTYTEKIFPYLIPLYDALYSLMPHQRVQRLQDRHILEIAPLAYMRGRTLSDAFVILDEAQNTRPVQMKMFLTRIGPRSRVVITGDTTQIDLPANVESGLLHAQRVLGNVSGIAFVHFDSGDVVRHQLVKRIVEAYGREQENRQNENNQG